MVTSSEDPILVVAALDRELAGLGREASLALLETGEGIANARRQLESWLGQRSARAVLSIGFAGALSSALEAGDIVVARKVRESSATPDARLLSAARKVQLSGPAPQFGVALTSNEIVWRAQSKRALALSLPEGEIGFVDMESSAIAAVCGKREIPFLIARAITDLLDEDLPLDFNQYRDHEGRIDQKRVFAGALLHPVSFRGLIELKKRSQACAERLAEFVRHLVPLMS